MNSREIIPIPENIVNLLLSKIKSLGRKMFLYFFSGLISFFIILFLMKSFDRTLRILIAFVSGVSLWVPFIGCFFERRNILADLEKGEMFYVNNFRETKAGYLYKNSVYEPVIPDVKNPNAIYILSISRYIVGFD